MCYISEKDLADFRELEDELSKKRNAELDALCNTTFADLSSDQHNGIGVFLYFGAEGFPKDCQQALRHKEMGALLGYADSQYSLGIQYHYGDEVEVNRQWALYWLSKAANNTRKMEHSDPERMLVVHYGVKNETISSDIIRYLKSMIDSYGYSRFYEELGICYEKGIGCKVDLQMACEYYRKGFESEREYQRQLNKSSFRKEKTIQSNNRSTNWKLVDEKKSFNRISTQYPLGTQVIIGFYLEDLMHLPIEACYALVVKKEKEIQQIDLMESEYLPDTDNAHSTYNSNSRQVYFSWSDYAADLQSYEWKEKRKSVLKRDKNRCRCCGQVGSIMNVHHRYYIHGHHAWEYDDSALVSLCSNCHKTEHQNPDVKIYGEIDGKLVDEHLTPCSRCGGAGYFPEFRHIEEGLCFRCHGRRYEEFIDWSEEMIAKYYRPIVDYVDPFVPLYKIINQIPISENLPSDVAYKQGRQYALGLNGCDVDFSLAVYYYQIGVKNGDAACQKALGLRYLHGEGVPKDYETAFRLFQAAADQKYAPAYYLLARCYQQGHGTRPDSEMAVNYFQKAAESDKNPKSMHHLFVAYKNGIGVEKNWEVAYQWREKSLYEYYKRAKNGDAKSLCDLAQAIEKDSMLSWFHDEKNELVDLSGKQFEYYRKSANLGFAHAQYRLAFEYMFGIHFKRNKETAIQWCNKAVAQDYLPAIELLEKIKNR